MQSCLLHLRRERHLSCSSLNQYGCAFRFFYATVLGHNGAAFQIPLTRAPQRPPEILSRDELSRLFAVCAHLKARAFLQLAYGTGLRLSELCHLQPEHIDSAADRMCIRVEQGKGAKDRYVPLAGDVLELLRDLWRLGGQPRAWLFATSREPSLALHAQTAQHWYRGRVRPRRHHQARRHPHPAPLLRHPPARSRRRPAQPVAMAGSQPRQHHHALPAPGAP